jgi:nicotinate phosphoribosyltransferase
MPNNCLLLVDTYNTIHGVQKAISVAKDLRKNGYEFLGIRLDSGNLASLSKYAREMLDSAGFPKAKIVASNDLDEYEITELKEQLAEIDVWGVGTRLITAYDQPALGGVYKLSAIKKCGDHWEPKIKLSHDKIKISNPGILDIKRIYTAGYGPLGDLIIDARNVTGFNTGTRELNLDANTAYIKGSLLLPIIKNGDLVYDVPSIEETRTKTLKYLARFPDAIRRIEDPDVYPVKLDKDLEKTKKDLIEKFTRNL